MSLELASGALMPFLRYNMGQRNLDGREDAGLYTPKLWRLLTPNPTAANRLSQTLNISPVLAQLLINRGIVEPEEARRFLAAPLNGLHDPSLLPGAAEAAQRIHQAVRDGRRICIYGDYDVDGITGTTLLWHCLRLAGADVDFYVPHRLEEGYGLNGDALRTLKNNGTHVVVTVDCGITSLAEAQLARELDLELIVTDHHEFRRNGSTEPCLPEASIIVHPRLPGSAYPFRELCGAGVAFKLAWAICQEFSQARKVTDGFRQFLLEAVTLVALGSVADVVPLADENRIFVRHGLRSLKRAPSVGLTALLEAAGLTDKNELDAGHISFALAPRLNAVGRLGQARLAVELLATSSPQRATDLARYLNDQNDLRQQLERRILRNAREIIDSEYKLDTSFALVLANDDWHAGVIGIVAGRLAEHYARPVLMISLKEEMGQGSGRSVDGLNLYEALNACSGHLQSFGGHAKASGFKIHRTEVAAFRERFCEHVAGCVAGRPFTPSLTIDAEVPLSAMTLGLMKGVAALHPYGLGNPRPLFLAGGLQVVGEPRRVGGGERHLQFVVRQETYTMKAVAFNMADRAADLMSAGGQCCILFSPLVNQWQGRANVEMEVCDFQPGPTARLAPL